jgi:photosystem II stability/assembly factor-like uncharacterized protein
MDKLVFKSTDGGATWSADISPDLGCYGSGDLDPSLSGYVLSMVLDPTDRNTLYLGAFVKQGLLKSNDGGANWSSVGLSPGVRTLVIDPTKPTTLYAGTGGPNFDFPSDFPIHMSGGVFKSTDGGASWSSAGLEDTAVTVLAIDPANSSTLYAGTESNYTPQGFRGMFKSTDSGASWLPINNGLASLFDTRSSLTALVIDPHNSNILYAGTSGGGVFRSIDSGANWSPCNDGLTNLDVQVLAVAPSNPNTYYAGTAGGVFALTFVP